MNVFSGLGEWETGLQNGGLTLSTYDRDLQYAVSLPAAVAAGRVDLLIDVCIISGHATIVKVNGSFSL